jgi:pimeloyl-ACP methyl ester carboxylesterase
VKTADGVRIAYTVSGAGPPIVVLSEPSASHVELEWSQPVLGAMFEQIAARRTLVRLDVRATGLSERLSDPGEAAVYGDVRAVVDALGLTRYALGGVQSLTPASIVYAARYPDEVSELVLIDPALRVVDMVSSPQLTAIMAAAVADWTIASEAIGLHVFGLGRHEAQRFGAYVRECIEPSFYSVALRARATLDATEAAPQVRAPALVVRHAMHPYISKEIAGDVTASIPGASQVTVPGLWADDPEALIETVMSWLPSV